MFSHSDLKYKQFKGAAPKNTTSSQRTKIITKPDAYGGGCSDRFSDAAFQATSRGAGENLSEHPYACVSGFFVTAGKTEAETIR